MRPAVEDLSCGLDGTRDPPPLPPPPAHSNNTNSSHSRACCPGRRRQIKSRKEYIVLESCKNGNVSVVKSEVQCIFLAYSYCVLKTYWKVCFSTSFKNKRAEIYAYIFYVLFVIGESGNTKLPPVSWNVLWCEPYFLEAVWCKVNMQV